MGQLEWIEVQGFRAFGEAQRLELGTQLAVIWGPNSQGKTSLAEAFEFLLTGTIVRRELMASSQDEFADALRNAHLPAELSVFVQAGFRSQNGSAHEVKRTLLRDFEKKAACESRLEIDGVPATEADLHKVGIVLSLPPMAAPILMQHTLGYLFSAKPQERSSYFKALLEVSDLDTLRTEVEFATGSVGPPSFVKQRELEAVEREQLLGDVVHRMRTKRIPSIEVDAAFATAARKLLTDAGLQPVERSDLLRGQLSALLASKQSKAFPLHELTRPSLGASVISNFDWQSLRTFATKDHRARTDIERLSNLFTELLHLPLIQGGTTPVDCPVCETKDALTPERLATIRAALEQSAEHRRVIEGAKAALVALKERLRQEYRLATSVRTARPWATRRTSGFTTRRMLEILPGDPKRLIRTWLHRTLQAVRVQRRYLRAVEVLGKSVPDSPFVDPPFDVNATATKLQAVNALREELTPALDALGVAEQALRQDLAAAISSSTKTAGWAELLTLWEHQSALEEYCAEARATDTLCKERDVALREIDRAKEAILGTKFTALSGSIKEWWDLLRPGHPTAFENVGMRPKAQRAIDFKAGLYLDENKTDPKIRDVVSVFSFSQLHCLGLAAFLARTVKDGCRLLVLDDPIMSSDEDHSAHFIDSVVEKLLDLGVQVVVLTQDHDLRTSLNERYGHLDVACFQVALSKPAVGAEVVKTSDALAAMLLRVQPLLGSQHEETRRTAARDLRRAAERFCKEVLVRQERDAGNKTAMLADFDGNLGDLIPRINYKDPSDMGKLKVIANFMNPGNHDDKAPSAEQIKVAHGNLGKFRKGYLSGAKH